ncbi:diguanylate cyclase regulator RdcB family protein [Thiorhodospira sibirica]|uniref:diguanylate cyclase regulator RdcB family protein n=1 Tax=Thiorhodospira sibirica TaxID=154347 RepID=UPI00022C1D5F|nr:diguanylate cyclase regulator RdcB family protein [Thiorhodospira sibirica]
MSNDLAPITPNSTLCQTLSCLQEKFVVDFANSIDVARDHIRVQRQRTGFFARMYDGFTGKGARRQTEINAGLVDGVEASLKWLTELTESMAQSNLAITQVNDRVSILSGSMVELSHYSVDTREQLKEMAYRLDKRMHDMTQEISRIDFIQKAKLNIDITFSKWEAGRFSVLSPAARCYAAMEELHWGSLGDYCRCLENPAHKRREFLQLVIDRSTKQLAVDAAVELQTPAEMATVWLAAPSISRSSNGIDMPQALSWLADQMTIDSTPFIYSAAHITKNLPSKVPLIAQARRIAEAMTHEIFPLETLDA